MKDAAGDAADVPAEAAVPPKPRPSCKDLRIDGITSNGIYPIDPDGAGPRPVVDAYCEMTIDGGGWTLVARSVENGFGPFGWRAGTGLVADDTAIYSIGGTALAIPFTEVLVAAREGDTKAIGSIAYKLGISSTDLTSHEATAISGYAVTMLLGACEPTNSPTMLGNTGFTSLSTAYFFRSVGATSGDNYGLQPSGFSLSFADCGWSGGLDGMQGMLFVR